MATVVQPEPAAEQTSAQSRAVAIATPVAVGAPVLDELVAPPAAATARGLRRLRSLRTFESLANPNFRWYQLSQVGAHGAGHMHTLVTGILVFQLTGSYAALGAIALATAVPGLALSLAGGVIADRLPKRMVQQTSTLLNALNALVLAVLLVAGVLRYEYLLASAFIQGTISGLMMPSRQSMIPDIVLPRHVMNAVALNNATMTTSRMIMPSIGGVLIALTAPYWAYFVMVGCHLFSIVTLFKVPATPIEVPPEEQVSGRESTARTAEPAKRQSGRRDLVDGMRYLVRDRTVGVLLLVNFGMVMFSMHWMQMLPGFVEQVLGGGPKMQGALISIMGIGSVSASLMVASLPNRHRGRVLLGGAALLGVSLVIFSFSSVIWITAPLMVLIGLGQSTRAAMSNVLVQSYAEDRYRGRVMSIYMMELSLVHVGTFVVGVAAEVVGIQWALGATAIALIVLVVGSYMFSPRMRALD